MHTSQLSPRLVRVVLPTGLTLASMFCGYLSITFALKGSFVAAAWLIVGAGVLDAVDGPLARALHAASKLGGELDSFADLVSFGLAPALLMYRVYFSHWGVAGLILGFLPTMVAALRLARYNLTVTAGDRDYFKGFTSTGNGCLIASFILFSRGLSAHPAFPAIAACLVVVSSALMISGVPYMTVRKFTTGGVWKTRQGAVWVPVWLSVLLFPAKAFFPAMVALMLQGVVGPRIEQVLHHVHGIRHRDEGIQAQG
jgi:CDP-diacylglycerol--serine O-phosphatidyltransferase